MAKSIIPHTKWSASKTALLNLLIEHGGQTIAELSSSLGVSVPYTTKTLNELIEDGLIEVTGKKDNYSKRAPKIYDLIATSGYFLGIDTGKQSLTFGICDFCGNMVAEPELIHFDYQDTPECFDRFINLINEYIQRSGIARSQIKKACMSIGGRVNPEIGCAYNYFTCTEMPLAEALTERLDLPFCIDNDTRCMTYGEYLKGVCKGLKNIIFVNVSWGIGIGIIFDGKLYLGKSGFSGEIGHMHIYNNDIICHCGKTGCMETETSGSALLRKMKEALENGGTSVLSDKVKNQHQELTLQDILDAIKKEDVLSIETLQKVAVELGTNLAGIINIFNPEMLVIGGDLSVTGAYLTQPICMGIKKFSLNMVNEDSQVAASTLKEHAGLIGACLMARSKYLNN
ncbi:ROK family transcriptional regulator [Segatella copri]|jgi:predicted NBD/HSP70 family sugar kinase|uniref:ROK family transcriptional regulator n=1 Tax=Segatella sinensis TaxID=3085167 RepID=A0ABV1FZQ9_9BACT|nr:ROK family transcriptional regulator [Segatella copri]MDD7002871.1 ROK family transcriptional regulator [Segatella copri]MDY6202981.1 ROK family transcriptional regulator [Segatella copri]MED9957510.1 ROK family transcriptional regulator [Segatella copri]